MYTRLMTIISLTVLCATAHAGLLENKKQAQRRHAQRILGFVPSETHILLAAKSLTGDTTYAALMLPPEAPTKEETQKWAADPEFSGVGEPGKVLYAARQWLKHLLSRNLGEGEVLPDPGTLKAWTQEIWDGGLNNLGQWQGDGFRDHVLGFAAQKKAAAAAARPVTPVQGDAATEVGSDGESAGSGTKSDGLSVGETPMPMTPGPLTPLATDPLTELDAQEANAKMLIASSFQAFPKDVLAKMLELAMQGIEATFASQRARLKSEARKAAQKEAAEQARSEANARAAEAAIEAEATKAHLEAQKYAAAREAEEKLATIERDQALAIDELTKSPGRSYISDSTHDNLESLLKKSFTDRHTTIVKTLAQRQKELDDQIQVALETPGNIIRDMESRLRQAAVATKWLELKVNADPEGKRFIKGPGNSLISVEDIIYTVAKASQASTNLAWLFYVVADTPLADLWADSQLPAEAEATLFKKTFMGVPETDNLTVKGFFARRTQGLESLSKKAANIDDEPHPSIFTRDTLNMVIQKISNAWSLSPETIDHIVMNTPWKQLIACDYDAFTQRPDPALEKKDLLGGDYWDEATILRVTTLMNIIAESPERRLLGEEFLPSACMLVLKIVEARDLDPACLPGLVRAHGGLAAFLAEGNLFVTSSAVVRLTRAPRGGAGDEDAAAGCGQGPAASTTGPEDHMEDPMEDPVGRGATGGPPKPRVDDLGGFR